ncbi:transient receptor potential cation channel subfamily M member 6 isoform X3 [Cynoglossus semilaevis]|nr:transient receptor potential cation channel subfamily M member 6-like isoform X3 [Cynoglossus semilaevis]
MLKEWQMEKPKLLLSVHGGLQNFTLPPKVKHSFSRGLITAALSTGAWIFTDGVNTGVSKYVGEAVKTFGSHKLRKRNTVGLTSWGLIDNNMELIGRDVFRPYQPVGNPLSKRASLNRFHSHFLLVDDGTLGKYGCQQGLRRNLEKQIQLQRIHPRLNHGVPVLCVVIEGGPALVSTVLDYVSRAPPVPVLIFEGSGRAADLLAFLHKQTANHRKLVSDIEQDFLLRISDVFTVDAAEASHLYSLLLQCMDYRQAITIFDSESEDQAAPDISILSATLKGTGASPAEQLSMTLAWDRADVAQKDVLVFGRHWQMGSLEQAMLDALLMDRVSFVKLLIDNGMTMSRFLTVERLEDLYNTPQGQTDRFLRHLVEDVKQSSLPAGYRLSLIDIGMVIEYLVGGAYRSTYTRKNFRAAYNRQLKNSTRSLSNQRRDSTPNSSRSRSLQDLHFRTAQPYRSKDQELSQMGSPEASHSSGLHVLPLLVFPFNYNDLFVWAVLQQRQEMALFLWQHGEEALARATVACKMYRSMSVEARQSGMDDNASERFKEYSLEFGRLAVDFLDCAFHQNEQMAMKLLTSEMEAWSHFTCLQMAVSSCHRTFVSHSCTQTLLTDLWTGPLNMRKNSVIRIILSLLLPPAVFLLEFKSKAEMCHVPQSHEVMLFSLDSVKSDPMVGKDSQEGLASNLKGSSSGSEMKTSTLTLCLSWIKRLYEFYTAPVVKFWFHTIFYLAFLMLFSFVVLVKMGDQPSIQEWLVIAYIMSSAVEKVREVLMSEPRKLSHKLKIWFSEYWNISDFVAILLFLSGLVLRWYPDPYRTAGRLAYCLDIIFWFIRLTELLAVNQHAGPYLTMITKMTSNMFFIVVMMAIVLLSFGVSRKAILSPDEEPSWSLARDVVFQPYWMIYGEVYAGEIDSCDDGVPCSSASFLTPFLQAVYMFFQYIIMVNILIAFFNNIYFDMASTSNKLWKYNRYRYIMTYLERPWLPPPLVVLSHLTLALSATYRTLRRDAEAEEKYRDRRSGLKLHLCSEDRKKLHEFEEKCVYTYKHKKREERDGGQNKRIKATAERSEEMSSMVGEVLEKVQVIQDSLSGLDCQLGQLQDLSSLVMDTATILSASDCLHQEEARLAQCGSVSASCHVPPPQSRRFLHKTGLEYEGQNPQKGKNWAFKSKSTPSSLLKGFHLVVSGLQPEEDSNEDMKSAAAAEYSLEASPPVAYSFSSRGLGVQHHFGLKDQSFPVSSGHSYSQTPFVSGHLELPYRKFSIGEQYLCHSQEETSVEEEKEEYLAEREEDEDNHEEGSQKELFPNMTSSRTSSHTVLLSNHDDISEGLVNPAFSLENSQPAPLSSDQCERHLKSRWNRMSVNHPYIWCRSLSSSVENITFCAAPLCPERDSFPSLCRPMRGQRLSSGRSFSDISKSTEWPRSSDLGVDNKEKTSSKKTVKIKEEHGLDDDVKLNSYHGCWRRQRWFRGEPTCWSASTSLSQLDFEPIDVLQKQMISPQDMWSPTHSAWNSWARSMSRRSSLQNFINPEVKSSSFSSMDSLFPHYSAMERNNLMRLALSVPFTPVSIFGGEEVSVYTLQDSDPSTLPPCWSTQGMSALLQPLSSEEGSLDGGLCLGCRALCTWAENDVLRTGLVYVVKAFKPEVVRVWQRYFPGDTALQLCLREIQQQRAAQRLMNIFNQIKPNEVQHTPRFLDVSLIQWHSSGQWFTIERNMTGHFRKYNNNTGEEIDPCCTLEETLLAFSHWTYQFSNRELLVLDLQGVGEELTDPTVVMAENQSGNRNELLFGADNLGDAAIKSFLQNHCCTSCCYLLGLTERRMHSDVITDDASSDIGDGQSSQTQDEENEE